MSRSAQRQRNHHLQTGGSSTSAGDGHDNYFSAVNIVANDGPSAPPFDSSSPSYNEALGDGGNDDEGDGGGGDD